MKKLVRFFAVSAFLGLFAGASAFALEASSLLSPALYQEVKSKGSVQKTYFKKDSVKLALVPNTELAKQIAASWTNSEKPVFIAENLYLLSKAELSSDPSSVTIEKASKVVRSVNTLQGITYYSRSDKKWLTLYKEAYSIKGASDRTRVADDVSGNADGKVLYCMLNDNSFGKTNYRLTYHQRPQELTADFVTTSGMYVGPVKAVDSGNLHISLCIIDCGEDLMVYMLVQAKFPAMSMLEDMLTDSFTSRLDAIYRWFTKSFK